MTLFILRLCLGGNWPDLSGLGLGRVHVVSYATLFARVYGSRSVISQIKRGRQKQHLQQPSSSRHVSLQPATSFSPVCLTFPFKIVPQWRQGRLSTPVSHNVGCTCTTLLRTDQLALGVLRYLSWSDFQRVPLHLLFFLHGCKDIIIHSLLSSPNQSAAFSFVLHSSKPASGWHKHHWPPLWFNTNK
jgi:hypothetical protein